MKDALQGETLEELENAGYFRTRNGLVFGPWGQLSLHRGWWWADVGCAVLPEGDAQLLPIRDPKDTLQGGPS